MRSAPRTLSDLYAAYKTRKLIGCRANTDGKYLRTIRDCAAILGLEPLIKDLTDDLVMAAMARKVESGRSPATVNDVHKCLTAIWAWGRKKGFVSTWPDVDCLHVPEAAPIAWTADELRRLFLAAENAEGEDKGVPLRLTWPAILCLLWDTGERVGAILSLPRQSLSGEWLTVKAVFRKGGTRDRVYRLHPETLAKLAALEGYDSERLIPVPIRSELYWRNSRYRAVLRAAGLPDDRKHMFHCIRKSVASHMQAAWKDASAAMDHASAATTRKHYLDPRIAKVASPLDVLTRPEMDAVTDGEKYSPEELRRLHEMFASKVGDILGVPDSLWWSTYALFTRDTATYPAGVKALPWAAFDLTRQEFDTRPFVCNVIRPFFSKLSGETVRLLGRYPVPRHDGPFAVKGKTIVQPDQRFKRMLSEVGVRVFRQAEPFIVYRRSLLAHATGPQGGWLMEPVLKFAE
jgi:integrase